MSIDQATATRETGSTTTMKDRSIGLLSPQEVHACLGMRELLTLRDLTFPLALTLTIIQEQPGTTSTEVAKRYGCTTANITALIEELVQRGFVIREANPRDRRVKHLRALPVDEMPPALPFLKSEGKGAA